MRVVNVFDALLTADTDEPDGYRAPYAKLGGLIGAERMGAGLMLLRQGEAVCPYHYEVAEEEWLIVLTGTPSVRQPAGTSVLAPGDLVPFPRGPEGAHKVFNLAAEPARVLIVSERSAAAVAVYPDGDKVGAFGPDLALLFRRADARDYWDGEAASPS